MKPMRTMTMLLALTALALGSTADLQAQQAQDPSTRALRELVAAPSPTAQDHEAIRSFLDRVDVEGAAREHGIDMERLRAGAATLDDAAASNLATRIKTLQEDQALVGGDTFVISATTVVIILLVLILIAVA